MLIAKYAFLLISAVSVLGCKKDSATNKEKYIVSASKMIGLTGKNWDDAAPDLNQKFGYQYVAASPGASNLVKAEVNLPAIDDSSKIEEGNLYINVTPDNLATFTAYRTKPIPQSAAYAMMLNYNNESLRILTGITYSWASYTEDNTGWNAPVDTVLSKLRSSKTEDRFSIGYKTLPRGTSFSLLLDKQADGQYIFSFTGNW